MWDLRYNRDGFSINAAIKKNRALPEWYLNEPNIDEAESFYLLSFWDLNTTRSFHMGFIPWDVKLQYAGFHGLDIHNTKSFIFLLGELDNAYLDWLSKEAEKVRKNG